MALHLEDTGLAIANIDHPGIFAGALDHAFTRRWKFRQMPARAFIGAMLRPHNRKHTQLDQIGLAAETFEQDRKFLGIDAMPGGGGFILRGEKGERSSVIACVYACPEILQDQADVTVSTSALGQMLNVCVILYLLTLAQIGPVAQHHLQRAARMVTPPDTGKADGEQRNGRTNRDAGGRRTLATG